MNATPAALFDTFRNYLCGIGADVPNCFLADLDAATAERHLAPKTLPCLRYLDPMVERAPATARQMVSLLAREATSLRWGQTYTAADFGEAFLDKYGWLEMVGTRGHFASQEIAAGFLILGPGVVYPDHHHEAEEVYLPLSDSTEWRKGDGAFVIRGAGDVIHHPPNVSHAMRTGAEPLLAIYLWRGGDLAQRSVIGGSAAGEPG